MRVILAIVLMFGTTISDGVRASDDALVVSPEPAATIAAVPCPDEKVVPSSSKADAGAPSLQHRLKEALAEGDVFLAVLLVLLAGFLTVLTPCVFPLIPITLSIFGARQTTHIRGFLLSSTYVGGMVLLYTMLGVGFAAFGMLAGSALQSSLVTTFVAVVCLTMAASMFGAFDITLPGNLQTKLSTVGGSGFRGAFFMGLVAGLIAAPCTGPVLSVVLLMIAKEGDLVKGAMLMFFYALGIGLPFLVLGTFSNAVSRLPKSGPWMDGVKSVFGVLMVTAGFYYLQFGFPPITTLHEKLGAMGPVVLTILLVAGAGFGAFHRSFKYVTTKERALKGIGVLLVTTSSIGFVGWASSTPEPASVTGGPENVATHNGTGGGTETKSDNPIAWQIVGSKTGALTTFETLLASAAASCSPVMIDFFAEWCAACKELDKFTYVNSDVKHEASRFSSIKVDATDDTDDLTEIQKRFSVVGLPTVVFIDKHGRVLDDPRVTGFVEPNDYLSIMKSVR